MDVLNIVYNIMTRGLARQEAFSDLLISLQEPSEKLPLRRQGKFRPKREPEAFLNGGFPCILVESRQISSKGNNGLLRVEVGGGIPYPPGSRRVFTRMR